MTKIQRRTGIIMGFCINCGNQHHDGVRFCRFCGTGQPSEQLLARLRAEAEQIRLLRMQIQQQVQTQNDAYARLEAMRQQAEAAAQMNNQQNQQYRPPGW